VNKELRETILTGKYDTAKVRIVSDGTPQGTFILADDKVLPCQSAIVHMTATDLVLVTLDVFIDDLDVEFEGEIVVRRKE